MGAIIRAPGPCIRLDSGRAGRFILCYLANLLKEMPRSQHNPRPLRRQQIARAVATALHNLPPERLRFCQEYLVTLDPHKAAASAGLGKAQGTRLLGDPAVQQCIAQLMRERSRRVGIEPDQVLERWHLRAFGDVNEVMQLRKVPCRCCHGYDHRPQCTPEEMRVAQLNHIREQLKLAASDRREFDDKGGADYDRNKPIYSVANGFDHNCPECFGDGDDFWYLHDSRKLSPVGQALYAGFKVTSSGIEVKLHDQQHALDMLTQHLGLTGPAAQAQRRIPRIADMTDEELDAAILAEADDEELPLIEEVSVNARS